MSTLSESLKQLKETQEFIAFYGHIVGHSMYRVKPLSGEELEMAVARIVKRFPNEEVTALYEQRKGKEIDQIDQIFSRVYESNNSKCGESPIKQMITYVNTLPPNEAVQLYSKLAIRGPTTKFDKIFQYVMETRFMHLVQKHRDWTNMFNETQFVWAMDEISKKTTNISLDPVE